MITLKPIKPNKPILDVAKLQAAIQSELRTQGTEAKKLYEQATSTWGHKPAFVVDVTKDGVTISTNDEIFGYVNLGTAPHIIRPKAGKVLRFNAGGFVPKTMPRSLNASSGSPGKSTVFDQEVHHPGSKPRNFDASVARKRAKPYAVEMQRAVDRAVK